MDQEDPKKQSSRESKGTERPSPKKMRSKSTLGSVYERRGVWYLRFWFRGREYRESSRSARKKDAEKLLERRRKEVVTGGLGGPDAQRVTFDDLVKLIEQDYAANARRSTKDMLGRVARLREKLGKVLPVDISHKMLKVYVADRQREGVKPATIRYELSVLGRMYVLAIQAGLLSNKPLLPTIKVMNARQGFFEPDEIARVLKHLPEDIAPAIEFASHTGWRIGEIRKLTWTNHLDLDAGVIRLVVGETKNDEARTFPFAVHPALRDLVVRQCERALKHGVPWLFPRNDGSQLGTFVKAWKLACAKAGCPGKLVHDLRRTAVRNLVGAGVQEKVAMTLTGHKTREVFDRYHIVDEADLANAVTKLAKNRPGA